MFSDVIFDLDGTLLDTLQDIAAAGNHALREMGLPQHPVASYRKMVGNGFGRLVQRMLPAGHSTQEYETAFSLFSEYYAKHMQDFSAPYPGIAEILTILPQNGIRLSVLSNKAHRYVGDIVAGFFPDVFALVVGLREGAAAKPDPGSVLEMLRLLPADPATTLYVGDSDVDMQTAQNAGLASCGVLWGFRDETELRQAGATYIAASPGELAEQILGRSV